MAIGFFLSPVRRFSSSPRKSVLSKTMSANRRALLVKTHKQLKKNYSSVVPNLRLPIMQQLLYACCLEDATADLADRALTSLETDYYDWNEVRVSTATELSESMHMLPAPLSVGDRVKRVLQSVFETHYSFDVEQLKKENIGVAVKKLHKFKGVTPFVVSYVTQVSLGGHSIPIGNGSLEVLYVIGAITEKEKAAGTVPGLERAIPKNKGIEFGSLLNQLAAEFVRAPFGPAARKILLAIAPGAKERLPKRSKKETASKQSASSKKKSLTKKDAAKKDAAKKDAAKKDAAKKAPSSTKKVAKTTKKAPDSKKKKVTTKPKAKGRTTVKKKAVKKKAVKKKVAVKKTTRKTASSRLSKRKPR
ncbi:MAG: hypothetical protein QF408_12200 [Pirellulales bacterium]|jgi:endonuclease-3|nr:hypothetical protein [Pirellulales bacterium]